MSSYVGPIVVGGFLHEKEAVPKDLGGPHMSSTTDTNLLFEKGKPRCMPILLPVESFIILCLLCIVHLRIGILWKCSCIKFSLLYYSCYICSYGVVRCAMLSTR
jgi:hypothetical protein